MFAVPLLLAALMFTSTVAIHNSGDDAYEMMQDVGGSVYRLDVVGRGGHGTGFVTTTESGQKVMVTNDHVCDGSPNMMSAVSSSGTRTIVHVIKQSETTDLCMLSAPRDSVPLELGDRVYKNEIVYAVGYPLSNFMSSGRGRLKGYQNIKTPTETPIERCTEDKHEIATRKIPIRKSDGSVETIEEKVCLQAINTYFTTVPTDRGYSGSPLLNDDGEVVGVVMGMVGNISWGVSVPLRDLREFLKLK